MAQSVKDMVLELIRSEAMTANAAPPPPVHFQAVVGRCEVSRALGAFIGCGRIEGKINTARAATGWRFSDSTEGKRYVSR